MKKWKNKKEILALGMVVILSGILPVRGLADTWSQGGFFIEIGPGEGGEDAFCQQPSSGGEPSWNPPEQSQEPENPPVYEPSDPIAEPENPPSNGQWGPTAGEENPPLNDPWTPTVGEENPSSNDPWTPIAGEENPSSNGQWGPTAGEGNSPSNGQGTPVAGEKNPFSNGQGTSTAGEENPSSNGQWASTAGVGNLTPIPSQTATPSPKPTSRPEERKEWMRLTLVQENGESKVRVEGNVQAAVLSCQVNGEECYYCWEGAEICPEQTEGARTLSLVLRSPSGELYTLEESL